MGEGQDEGESPIRHAMHVAPLIKNRRNTLRPCIFNSFIGA